MYETGIFQIGFKMDTNRKFLEQRSYIVILNTEDWAGQVQRDRLLKHFAAMNFWKK